MTSEIGAPSYDVVVIGGSQAGLAIGYHLAQSGTRFVILDAGPEMAKCGGLDETRRFDVIWMPA